MKKLFSLLFIAIFIFTGCSKQDDMPVYEKFVFDESLIASTEYKNTDKSVRTRLDYDKYGRLIREQKQNNSVHSGIVSGTEYMYNPDGSYIAKHTSNDTGFFAQQVGFSLYDKDGNLTDIFVYYYEETDNSYRPYQTQKLEINNTGLYTLTTTYNDDGSVQSTNSVQYGNDDIIVHSVETNEDGYKHEYFYDEEAFTHTKTGYKDDVQTEKTITFYSEKGIFLREEWYDGDNKLVEYTIPQFNRENGLREKFTTYYPDGNIKEQFLYDEKGYVSQYVYMDPDGNIISDEFTPYLPEN